jgi:hypothetical protein
LVRVTRNIARQRVGHRRSRHRLRLHGHLHLRDHRRPFGIGPLRLNTRELLRFRYGIRR